MNSPLGRRRVLVAAASLLATTALVGTHQPAAAAPTCGAKLAVLGPLTGPAASFGIPVANGAKLAVRQYNANHVGCEVSVVQYDSQGAPAKAQPLARAIVADASVLGVVGPMLSGESIATGSIFAQAGLPTISPSATNPAVTSHGWKTFQRVVANDAVVGQLMAKYVVNNLRRTRIAVVNDNSDYGRTLARSVRVALGRKVVLNAAVKQGQTTFTSLARSVRAKRVNAVVYAGYYPEAGRFDRQLNRAGYEGPFLGGDGIMDPAFKAITGATIAARAHIVSGNAPLTLSASFTQAYRSAFGSAPRYNSLEAYDAARVFLAGLNNGAATRSAMLSAVDGFNGQGLTKKIAFTARGEVIRPPVWAYKPVGSAFAVRTRVQ